MPTSILKSIIALITLVFAVSVSAGNYKSEKKDIVDIAASDDNFSTLVAALKAADLVDALKGDKTLTVFAPTNEAFAKLPPGTLEDLLKPENKEKLVEILTYHVVSGNIKAKDVVKVDSATSLQGQDITVNVDGQTVMVDNAKVVKTDIVASNGVIHVIDEVILPKS